MRIHCLSAFLAIVLTTACASAHRVSVPSWQRYQDGELAGFLHAPGEHVVSEVPEVAVQRVRGRFFSRSTEWLQANRDSLRPEPTVRVPDHEGNATPDLGKIDTNVFVVELRGPGSRQKVRTLAMRSGVFDFGPLPNGTYTLKATASGSGTVLGWSSKIRTVIVSDAADAAAVITVW